MTEYLLWAAATAIFGAICLLAGLVIGASRRDGPATYHEPMNWQSDTFGGEK